MSYRDFKTKAEYKKYHAKVIQYVKNEYIDFHFNKMRNGSLLIQLSPFDKHHFHLLVGTFSSPTESVNNVAGNVVCSLYKSMYNQTKKCEYYE
jgi:hypothetical protein